VVAEDGRRSGRGRMRQHYLTWCYPLLIIAIVQTAERADRAKVDALADSCVTGTSAARLPLWSG
jgi:hypothetical protein